MDNLAIYEMGRQVPPEAQKPITAGRLKGMTDITPMWRIKKLTEIFGPCGIGWGYDITDKRIETAPDGQACAFVDILFWYVWQEKKSIPYSATGGSKMISKESGGLYVSDECFKMALTDAISVAAKGLGIGADIYFSKDRTKYTQPEQAPSAVTSPPQRRQNMQPVCCNCGKPITSNEHSYSMNKFGKPLCRGCQG